MNCEIDDTCCTCAASSSLYLKYVSHLDSHRFLSRDLDFATSRLMEGPQWDFSEQAASDYDPCAGRLAAKTEAMATLRDVRRLFLSANANSQWLAVGI